MRTVFVLAFIAVSVALLLLAVVFRVGRARAALRFLRKAAWAYIAVIIAVAIWEFSQNGW